VDGEEEGAAGFDEALVLDAADEGDGVGLGDEVFGYFGEGEDVAWGCA